MFIARTPFDEGYVHGVKDAAAFIDTFNSCSTHNKMLGDIILGKFNLTARKRPRVNKRIVLTQDV